MAEYADFVGAERKILRILKDLENEHGRSIWGVDVAQSNEKPRQVEAVQIRIETYSYPMVEGVTQITKETP